MFQYVLLKQLELNYGIKDVKADFSFFTKGHTFFEDRISKLDVNFEKATEEEIKEVCFLSHNQEIWTWKYRVPLFIEKTINPYYYFESDRGYTDPKKLLKYKYLDGYWQSWRYMHDIDDLMRKEFNILYRCSDQTQKQADIMMNQNSVLVGVRKGDYLKGKDAKHYAQIDADYQIKAAKYIAERVENPVFHVFSNDIKWAHDNLDFGNLKVVFRDPEIQVSDIEEMQLMSACKHAIIPNGTFHWFGAFLINNKKKIVVRPEKMFADGSPEDIFPPFWVTITN